MHVSGDRISSRWHTDKMPKFALTDTNLLILSFWCGTLGPTTYTLGIVPFALLDTSPVTFFIPTVMSRAQVAVGIFDPNGSDARWLPLPF